MLEEGLSYPFKGDNALGRNLIGGLLLAFFWLLFIPLLAFFGYIVKVLRTTVEGEEAPPEFENWGSLLGDGLKSAVIFFVYAIVPYALLLILVASLGVAGVASGEGGAGLVAGVGIVGFLLVMVFSIAIQYVLPAALTNFAREGRVGAAFDFDTITDVILTSEYFVAWLLPIVVFVMLYVVGIVLAFTIVGILLFPWLYFYGFVVTYRMFGRAYVKALDLDAGGTAGRQAGEAVA